MEWITVVALVILGIGLIVVEVIFVPGTTIVGIMGFCCAGVGVYLGYDYFGNTTGSIILAVSAVVGFGAVFYSFRSEAWQRFSLKGENKGRYNEDFKIVLAVGQEGTTISSLKPVGKAMFNEQTVEVKSQGGYVEENKKVRVIKLETNKIIVEPI